MSIRNIKIEVEYKGAGFSGWQSQVGQKTIQDEICDAVFRTTGERVNVIGAGRTDAGVHALRQVANFQTCHRLETESFKEALNFYLPDDIRVRESTEVALDFHARRDALFKRYRYLVGLEKSAIYRDLRWEYDRRIDYPLLKKAAAEIVGEHDFSPFCVVSSRKKNNLCRIDAAFWRKIGPLLVFEIRGNRFLHTMVRSLVGAMVNLATIERDRNKHNLTLERFGNIIRTATSERMVFTAPAHGLYLVSVAYSKG